jgi:hypothetical protein
MFTRSETKQTTLVETPIQKQDTALVQSIKEANGAVKNNATLETLNYRPVVESLDITLSSPAHADAVEKDIYLFNEDFLNATPARNSAGGTAGAEAITKTYGDGFTGKVYNKMIENSFNANGLKIKEIIIVAKQISTGVGDESFFSKAKMKLYTPTGEDSDNVNKAIKWGLAVSNQPNKDGIYRMAVNFRLHYLNQIKFKLSPDTEVNISFIPAEDQN